MKSIIPVFFVSISILSLHILHGHAQLALDDWIVFSGSAEKYRLVSWLKMAAYSIIDHKEPEDLPVELPQVHGRSGLFITLIKKGKVRGCFGAFDHTHASTDSALKGYLKGALFLDPRYRPLEKFELADTDIILTVTSHPEPVSDINEIDISGYGIYIECWESGNRIIVPAEYRTTERIMVQGDFSDCRIYRFRAVTIK